MLDAEPGEQRIAERVRGLVGDADDGLAVGAGASGALRALPDALGPARAAAADADAAAVGAGDGAGDERGRRRGRAARGGGARDSWSARVAGRPAVQPRLRLVRARYGPEAVQAGIDHDSPCRSGAARPAARVARLRERLRAIYGDAAHGAARRSARRARPDRPLAVHERPQPRRRLPAAAASASRPGRRCATRPSRRSRRRSSPAACTCRSRGGSRRSSRRCPTTSTSRGCARRRSTSRARLLCALPGRRPQDRRLRAALRLRAARRAGRHARQPRRHAARAAAPGRAVRRAARRDAAAHAAGRRARAARQPPAPRPPHVPRADARVPRLRAAADVPGAPGVTARRDRHLRRAARARSRRPGAAAGARRARDRRRRSSPGTTRRPTGTPSTSSPCATPGTTRRAATSSSPGRERVPRHRQPGAGPALDDGQALPRRARGRRAAGRPHRVRRDAGTRRRSRARDGVVVKPAVGVGSVGRGPPPRRRRGAGARRPSCSPRARRDGPAVPARASPSAARRRSSSSRARSRTRSTRGRCCPRRGIVRPVRPVPAGEHRGARADGRRARGRRSA